ncbi:MAG TPA: RNA polymerase sigma factor [Devosia sp.]|nr:RNA polymerase sigma factor [Devosia sp.]
MSEAATNRAIEAVWRIESPRLIAGLTRIVRDISMAEELAMDALVVAMKQWPEAGVPTNPGAWLMTTAKRRAIDHFRRNRMAARKLEELGADVQNQQDFGGDDPDARLDDDIGDDLLRLVFTSCHPILSMEARVALTLKLIGGLTTDEIARAYLVPEPTVAQRIVRAKKTIAEARIPYEVPRGAELQERLGAVLGVIYLIFNEGYSATSGSDWMRPQLCTDALRLGRVVAELAPKEPEVHGLVALMEIQASRQRARTAPDGAPILLLDQDRAKWDWLLVGRGLRALDRAEALGGRRGSYRLQAAIAACHGRARKAADTDWMGIAHLYDELAALTPSPIVELNRSVAYAMAYGPEAGLAIADDLVHEPALQNYHLLPSVRGDFLFKLGRRAEARAEFERAAALTRNERERTFLLDRAAASGPSN